MRTQVDLNWLNRFISNSGFGHRRRYARFLILVVAVILAVGTTGILVLNSNPDVNGIYSAAAPMAVGAAQALKARELEKKLKLVTFDPSPEVIPLFEDGTIQAIAAQNPYQMGYQGVTMLDTIIKGGQVPANQKKIQIPVVIIAPDNYKSPDVQKLMQTPSTF